MSRILTILLFTLGLAGCSVGTRAETLLVRRAIC
jgi:hypothetical protein